MCLSICQQYAIIRSKSLPGVGITGVTGGLIIITDGVATGCVVIVISIDCIIVIVVPSGPITGIENNESPTKSSSPVPPGK